MKYKDLEGNWRNDTIWSPGPKTGTVWVVDLLTNTARVVNPTKSEEVEYTGPAYLEPPNEQMVNWARGVVAEKMIVAKLFSDFGARPVDEEYAMASQILEYRRQAERSRLPYIEAHGGRKPISDKRFKELAEADDGSETPSDLGE